MLLPGSPHTEKSHVQDPDNEPLQETFSSPVKEGKV